MKNLFLTLLSLFLVLPTFALAQEYGNANSDKKIVVATFDTPFKTAVFTQFAEEMATEGYHVTIVTPEKFTAPVAKTLVIYGEGGLKGQPWSDEMRKYIANNPNSIYFHTFKRNALPPVAKGVDTVSSASKSNVRDTVKILVAKAKQKMN